MRLKSFTKTTINTVIFFLLTALVSCDNDEIKLNTGELDLSNYVSVGNSLTAGYSDGGLYRELQLNSYPSILGHQFQLNFDQPLMPEGNGSGYVYLTSYVNGIPGINYLQEDPQAFNKVKGPFDNLGVPGIRVKDINMKDYGLKNNNPYFYRMLPAGSESSTSYLDLIEQTNPTFFTCWMGNNDILGYATSGGADGIDGAGKYGLGGITDLATFETNFQMLIDELTENDAKGIVITIPDITLIPFFNLVSNNDFPTLNESWLNDLNENYEEFNMIVDEYNEEIEDDEDLSDSEKEMLKREKITFSLDGNNAFVIEDKDLPDIDKTDGAGQPIPKIRHLRIGEKITLTGVLEITNLSKLSGINQPLEDEFVLTISEIDLIDEYRQQFNEIISQETQSPNIALIDADELLSQYISGKTIDGIEVSTEFIEGGLFSLDGIHLTARGYALVANEIINEINHRYSAQIPKVNISQFEGVNIP